jgi:hypothetical protein
MSGDTKKPTNKRGDALPTDGYGLEVDGKVKSRHETAEAAVKAGLEIKRNFPVVQISVFDAVKQTHTLVELPKE